MFPKGGEVQSKLYFDELRNKMFITFNYQLTMMSMKSETRDRVLSHEKPVTASLYNETYNQVNKILYISFISALNFIYFMLY